MKKHYYVYVSGDIDFEKVFKRSKRRKYYFLWEKWKVSMHNSQPRAKVHQETMKEYRMYDQGMDMYLPYDDYIQPDSYGDSPAISADTAG